MALSVKVQNQDGMGATVITFVTSDHVCAPPPIEPNVHLNDNTTPTHAYERHPDEHAIDMKRILRIEASEAITAQRARSDPSSPENIKAATSTDPSNSFTDTLLIARQTLSASYDIEAKWKAFQQAFDNLNKQLIDNIGQMMHAEAENNKKEHVTIDLQTATRMLQDSSHVVFLTGAGMSVSSGLPTYRLGSGLGLGLGLR
jgi:hypothetical protein